MRIISDYYDYYDGVQYAGEYTKDVWIRNRKNHLENRSFSIQVESPHQFNIIGFCGKLYPVIVKYTPAFQKKYNGYYYKMLELLDDMTDEDIASSDVEILYDYKPSKKHGAYYYKRHVEFQSTIGYNRELINIFYEKKTPIFVATYIGRGVSWIVNYSPILKNYDFYKKFDSYQAFQEIEMFMSNQLVECDNPDQITDNIVLRDSKGFDKWTFKTMPTKRKKR